MVFLLFYFVRFIFIYGMQFILNEIHVKIFSYICLLLQNIMEKTIIVKPNPKTVSVLKKLVDLKQEHRKEVISKLKKK